MSRYSTPTSDFGDLGLGGSSSRDMPVQTRAMSRREGQIVTASQAASSRVQTEPGPSRRRAPQSGLKTKPSDTMSGDDDSDGSNDSPDDSSDEEQNQPAQLHEILSIYDPGLATPGELTSENGPDPNKSRATLFLIETLKHWIRTDHDLETLNRAIEVPGPFWSGCLAANMRRRFELIAYRLEQDRRNVQPGQGVVQTVAKIVNLASAIDIVRDSYQARMAEASQAPFVALLVDMLRFLIERNEDLYAGTTRPIFAGDDFQSERRLFASFIAPRGQAILFLGYVGRWGRAALRPHAPRLADIYALMLQQLSPEQRQDMASHVRNVVMALRTLASEAARQTP
ncbi:hypothetical protein M433DRAFT_5404 [Acidomyces richmondensis BFW]|nr:hypothetical protein M433DRAFT_5404 [Acidomyces richmondensis BFW]